MLYKVFDHAELHSPQWWPILLLSDLLPINKPVSPHLSTYNGGTVVILAGPAQFFNVERYCMKYDWSYASESSSSYSLTRPLIVSARRC